MKSSRIVSSRGPKIQEQEIEIHPVTLNLSALTYMSDLWLLADPTMGILRSHNVHTSKPRMIQSRRLILFFYKYPRIFLYLPVAGTWRL